MTITLITRVQAGKLTGYRLPYGMHWYQVSGLEFYPNYGDWSHTWAGDDGLNAVIGKRKQEASSVKFNYQLLMPTPTPFRLRDWREYKGYLVCCDHVDCVIVGNKAVVIGNEVKELKAA